ncbi:MAG: calcium/sodium antiporter, partial [Balneolaceae bacterium]|nr:calcium/sodium antiporter [Balneolaceae bacterium]
PIVIGVTVVAFATSSPEIAVSLDAAVGGKTELALGNVIGSNIANILLILGASAVISSIQVQHRIIWVEVPVMVGITLLVYLLALDQVLGMWDGIVLLLVFAGFIGFQIYETLKIKRPSLRTDETEEMSAGKPAWIQGVYTCIGIVLLIFGAKWLVDSSIILAREWGLSELIIGLSVIALGTSLPELATSVVAAWKKESDISVGNVVGSNIFNLLLVLAISAMFASGGLKVSSAALSLDFPFLIAVSVACLPIFFTGHEIARWEGYLFLSYYVAYMTYLILDTTQHELLPLFSTVMLLFVAPITVLTLIIFGYRYRQKMNRTIE